MRTNMKKTFSILITGLICGLMIAGCGKKDSDIKDRIENAGETFAEKAEDTSQDKKETADSGDEGRKKSGSRKKPDKDAEDEDLEQEPDVEQEPEDSNEAYGMNEAADPYWGVLLQYKEAQDGEYSMEQVEAMGLQTGLVQHGWPNAYTDDEVRYLYYDINSDEWIDLIITYYGEIVDIYSHDGDAVYSYGAPYRSIVELYPDGSLSELLSISVSKSKMTWYKYDVDSGKFLMQKGELHPKEDPVKLPEGKKISELGSGDPPYVSSKSDSKGYTDEEYYGVFIASFKERDDCWNTTVRLEDAGYHLCPTLYTPDFSNLNPLPYYAVTAGLFTSEEEADDELEEVKKAGFKEAYVKSTGKYIGDRCWYTMHGGYETEVLKDRIILHDVSVTIPYLVGEGSDRRDLYIDGETVFDEKAELEFFGNYEKGETPYKWISRNYRLMSEEPDKYMESGPALAGIFEVSLTGDHIDRYYGCYWWD